MTSRITTSFIAVLIFLSLGSLLSCSAMGETGQELPLPNDIPGLIEALASPNIPPTLRGPLTNPVYPKRFDRVAQERVVAAQLALVEKGVTAIPYLIKRLSDTRYSKTVSYSVDVNLSVGDVCQNIIEEQVLPRNARHYKGARKGADGKPHQPPYYFYWDGSLPKQGGLEKWWSTHSTKSLLEIRIEVLQWTIQQEEKIGFPTSDDRKRYLEPLETELRQLELQREKRLPSTD